MTTQAGVEERERDLLAQCVGDAYQMLDVIPGVDPNGLALVWLADQFLRLRRGSSPSAHAMAP
jgi:hypothetical protein